MTTRYHAPLLGLVLLGAMAIISCSTSDTATSTVLESGASAPRIVTVLQSEA